MTGLSSNEAGRYVSKEEGSVLIYISSYPRSGNTWVRILIRHYFDRRSSSIYPEPTGDPNLVQDEDGSFGPAFSEYQTQYPPITTRRRLVNGCGPILTEELRRHLGASDEHFFLKTHELPYEKYCDGECVIHLVRHPGAVFWSYYNYLLDFEVTSPNLTKEDVIKGQVPFGSWSEYTERWLECGEVLGDRFLIYSYEQLSCGEAEFCEKVSSLTGLPIRREIGSYPPFEHWRDRFSPKLFRSGKVDEWKSHLSGSQLELVKRLHNSTVEKLGYELDDTLVTKSKSWIRSLRARLAELI